MMWMMFGIAVTHGMAALACGLMNIIPYVS